MRSFVVVMAAAVMGCGSTAPVEVSLSSASFATTGGNLFNCATPAQPADRNSIQTQGLGCEPQRNPDGNYSTTPVTIATRVGCGDGHGAILTLTCVGTGKDRTVSGTVGLAVTPDCNSSDSSGSTATTFAFQGLAPGASQTTPPLTSCADFDDICTTSDPCAFNDFTATVTITNAAP